MDILAQRVLAIRDDSSFLWMFYHPEECSGGDELVEARLDIEQDRVKDFAPPESWALHHVQWDDSVFIRARQSMAKLAIAEMLIELIHCAHVHGGKLHSWLHGAANIEEGN
jgi:hypothetical protein